MGTSKIGRSPGTPGYEYFAKRFPGLRDLAAHHASVLREFGGPPQLACDREWGWKVGEIVQVMFYAGRGAAGFLGTERIQVALPLVRALMRKAAVHSARLRRART